MGFIHHVSVNTCVVGYSRISVNIGSFCGRFSASETFVLGLWVTRIPIDAMVSDCEQSAACVGDETGANTPPI